MLNVTFITFLFGLSILLISVFVDIFNCILLHVGKLIL